MRLLRLAIGALISLGLLAWMLARADLGNIQAILASADWALTLCAYGIILAANIVHSVRWWFLIVAVGGRSPFSQLLALHFLGLLVNSLIPGQLGLDVTRVQFGGSLVGGRARMLVVTLADRLVGAFALAVLAGVSYAAMSVSHPDTRGLILLPAGVLGLLGITAVIARAMPAAVERIVKTISGQGGQGARAHRFLSTVRLVSDRPRHLMAAAGCAGLQFALMAGALALLATALELPASSFRIALAFPAIGLVTMVFPISFNGIGVREAMFCATMIPLGLTRSQALALAFAWFAIFLLGTAPGVLGWLVLGRTNAEAADVAELPTSAVRRKTCKQAN